MSRTSISGSRRVFGLRSLLLLVGAPALMAPGSTPPRASLSLEEGSVPSLACQEVTDFSIAKTGDGEFACPDGGISTTR